MVIHPVNQFTLKPSLYPIQERLRTDKEKHTADKSDAQKNKYFDEVGRSPKPFEPIIAFCTPTGLAIGFFHFPFSSGY
jgi:hypothetical protein